MAKKLKKASPVPQRFKLLSEYEIGRSVSAIETVLRLGKPIAEVMTRKANPADLKKDLEKCLTFVPSAVGGGVKAWVREAGEGRYRYGFYREKWTLSALEFLHRATLNEVDRAWIQGLFFGYTSREIQKFINRR